MSIKEALTQVAESSSKDLNWLSVASGLVGGFLASRLGGVDTLLGALLGLTIVDYITGLLKAWKLNVLDTKVAFVGIIKKVLIFVVVAVSVIVESVIGDSIPLREIVILFYISNEGMSFIENISEFVDMPPAIQKAFIQIRDRSAEYDVKDDDQ